MFAFIGFIMGTVGFVCGVIEIYKFVERKKLTPKAKKLYTNTVEPKAKELIKKVKEKVDETYKKRK